MGKIEEPPKYTPTVPTPSSFAYPAPPPESIPNVVISMPVPIALGPSSQKTMCPHCHYEVSTTVTTEPSTKTHLIALLLCLIGCWPCCCLPYCMDSCQNRNHSCPNCKAYLGVYKN